MCLLVVSLAAKFFFLKELKKELNMDKWVSESHSVISNSLLMDYRVHGILQARILEYSSPGDLPNPGIETRSPALQMDSLPAELLGSPWLNKMCYTHTVDII